MLPQVPAFTPDQAEIPFARVNHNKYMVTEKVAYIGKQARKGSQQGCQICFDTIHIPKPEKMYQLNTKCTKLT
jgi:hypothetical protein